MNEEDRIVREGLDRLVPLESFLLRGGRRRGMGETGSLSARLAALDEAMPAGIASLRNALPAITRLVIAAEEHRRFEVEVMTWPCANGECDHTGDCPTEPLLVCAQCYAVWDDDGARDDDEPVPDSAVWPCPVGAALDALGEAMRDGE